MLNAGRWANRYGARAAACMAGSVQGGTGDEPAVLDVRPVTRLAGRIVQHERRTCAAYCQDRRGRACNIPPAPDKHSNGHVVRISIFPYTPEIL
jgi:hypothetical protein